MKAKVRQVSSGDSTSTLAEFGVNSDNSKQNFRAHQGYRFDANSF